MIKSNTMNLKSNPDDPSSINIKYLIQFLMLVDGKSFAAPKRPSTHLSIILEVNPISLSSADAMTLVCVESTIRTLCVH